jgi:hypothetical protein
MLTGNVLARSYTRRNRPNQRGQTRSVRACVGAIARAFGEATLGNGPGDTEVFGAEVGVFEGYDGGGA